MCGLGGVLLFRVWLGAVPLALGVLASGFGMGPGVSSPLWPPRGLWWGACRGCRGCCGCGVVVVVVVVLCGGWWVVVGGLVVGRIVDAVCFPGVWSPPFVRRVLARGCGGGVWVCLCWPVSTSRLRPLPGVHVWPIDPVVFWGPSRRCAPVETWS